MGWIFQRVFSIVSADWLENADRGVQTTNEAVVDGEWGVDGKWLVDGEWVAISTATL